MGPPGLCDGVCGFNVEELWGMFVEVVKVEMKLEQEEVIVVASDRRW